MRIFSYTRYIGLLAFQAAPPIMASLSATCPPPQTNVITSSGRFIGHAAPDNPRVTEFLGIRYAQPPTQGLRFAAPVTYRSADTFEASNQPPDCPYVAQPWGSVPKEAWSHAPRIMAQESANGYNAMSEDCLQLNIWTPSGRFNNKTVMIFLYGGGFDRGSINNPAYIGAKMAGNQDIVVVTFNYRVNIFGFANAPGTDTNVALRDVRLAVEWVRDNIVAFGGSPDSITLFGQSQGAYLISYYAYAFADDPIAHSFIQQSGTAFSSPTDSLSNKAETWRNVSASIGCNNASDIDVLRCMRAQNVSSILAAWTTAPPTTTQSIPFGPAIDGELIFSNYTQQTMEGRFAQRPFLMGSNSNEAGFYVLRFAGDKQFTLNQTDQDLIGFGSYVCPTALDAAAKAQALARKEIPVYRYQYFGDWPNLALYASSGAYHTSETSVVFGTMEELSGDPNTELEENVSLYMQTTWANFAKNPQHGLQSLGWPTYDPTRTSLIRLGYGEETTASFDDPAKYDAICGAV